MNDKPFDRKIPYLRYEDQLTVEISISATRTSTPIRVALQPDMAMLRDALQSIHTNDEAIFGLFEDYPNEVDSIRRGRQNIAKDIAEELTDYLIKIFARNDTHNGYKKER